MVGFGLLYLNFHMLLKEPFLYELLCVKNQQYLKNPKKTPKPQSKTKLGGQRGRQERVHFCFDRLGLDSKLLTDQNAFEVTFSVSKNSTTARQKPDLERVVKEQVERNSIKLRSEFSFDLAVGDFSNYFVNFSAPLCLNYLLLASISQHLYGAFLLPASRLPLVFGFMTVECCGKGILKAKLEAVMYFIHVQNSSVGSVLKFDKPVKIYPMLHFCIISPAEKMIPTLFTA